MKKKKPFRARLTLRDLPGPLGAAVVLFLATMALEGGLRPSEPTDFWRVLCDALTVPGILLTGSGLLRVVSGLGVFNGLRFGVRKAADQLRSEEKRALTPKTYYDYVEQREEKPRKSSGMMLIVGVSFLLAAGVTLGVYLSL